MRILVTGGAGFIGSHIADDRVAAGDEVFVLDDLSTGKRTNVPRAARFLECDVRHEKEVRRLFRDVKPDVVSHQAAQTSVAVSTRNPAEDAAVNVIGGLHVLAAALEVGVKRFVFASTGGAIYGEVPDGQAADTAWRERPESPYGCAKLAFEHYLRAEARGRGMAWAVLRYANVYGPRQDPHGEAGVVAIFLNRMLRGESVAINAMHEKGDDGCIRDYVFVADVVRAHAKAVAGAIDGRMANVGTGMGTTTRQLAEALARLCALSVTIEFAERRSGDLRRSVLQPDAEVCSGERVPIGKGLALTAEWFKTLHAV
jgi:UDP-glucose 4-epimerase